MTYRVGMGGSEPRITCDRCGAVFVVRPSRGGPPGWLVDGKAPKGWSLYLDGDGLRRHLCPACAGSR